MNTAAPRTLAGLPGALFANKRPAWGALALLTIAREMQGRRS